MPRWHNIVAIIAIFFVAGAVWPWSTLNRAACAAVAFALIIVVLISRMQKHASSLTGSRSTIQDAEARIDRIREDREKRFSRR